MSAFYQHLFELCFQQIIVVIFFMRTLLYFVAFFISFIGKSQSNTPEEFYKHLLSSQPEVVFTQKLVFVVFSETTLNQSTSGFLRELERCTEIYKNARLKNGHKGLSSFFIDCNMEPETEIMFHKQHFTDINYIRSAQFTETVLPDKTNGGGNILFNDKGEVLARNIQATEILNTINSQITR